MGQAGREGGKWVGQAGREGRRRGRQGDIFTRLAKFLSCSIVQFS